MCFQSTRQLEKGDFGHTRLDHGQTMFQSMFITVERKYGFWMVCDEALS
jgi:hypothetical protein